MTGEDAIRRIKARFDKWALDDEDMKAIKTLIPELAEREDERIIEEIKFAVMQMPSSRQDTKNRCLAWLEKQKEQKPKFYPGDVIKCTSTGSLWVRCKDGDNIRSDGHTACIGGGYELASKEEAVQFFQELNENGYQWDCIKGRPMKKEQKPAEWSNEDADMLNCCISSIEEAKENRYAYKETDGDTSYDREIDWLKSLSRKFSLQPKQEWSEEDKTILKVITSDVARTMHRCGVGTDEASIRSKAIRWLETLCPNQKSEWSEEDERKRNGLIKGLEDRMGFGWASDPFSREEYIDWLKSLRPQLKQKWSEEDKKMLWIIQLALTKHPITDKQEKDAFDWLNSLRPQPQTKTNDYITPHKKFFKWIYNRLIDVHGENPNVDYMRSFKERIDNLQFDESQWKPSEDEVRLINTSISFLKDFADKGYENAVECIDWLKLKLNGNTCK